jgi:type II secretory pathway component PulC
MNLKRYLLLTNICFVALIFWVASNIVLTWASKKQNIGRPQISHEKPTSSVAISSNRLKKLKDYQSVIRYDVFDTTISGPVVPVKDEKTLRFTDLNLKLKGTVVGENRNSYAIILDGKTNKEDLYYLNDFVHGARIVQVLTDRVVFELKGSKEILLMEDITAPSAPPEPEIKKKKRRPPKKRKTRSRPRR